MKAHTILASLCLVAGTIIPCACANAIEANQQETGRPQPLQKSAVIEAKPYRDTASLLREYKYGRHYFDKFENPTGVFVKEGDKLAVTLDGTPGSEITLLIHSFEPGTVNKETQIPLTPGDTTHITAPHEGLTYIHYYTENGGGKPVKVTISGGTNNGVYHKGDGPGKWQELIHAPGSEYIDIVGKYVHLIYNKEGLREHCAQDVDPLLTIYDDIVEEQHAIMGLLKYGRWYGNHLNGRNGEGAFMHADGIGAYYSRDCMGAVTDLNALDYWAIAHEFAHLTQLSPGLNWHGTTEVTNNISSARARYKYTPDRLPLEDNPSATPDGTVAGGCFNCFFQGAIINKEPFRYQMGPSDTSNYLNGTGGDVFVSLIPFWQLDLYFHYAGMGNKDFYPDLCEKFRKDTDDKSLTPGESQVRFCKYACDVTQQNLMPYFRKVGLLAPVDRIIGDYAGKVPMIITPDMVKEAEEYGAQYPAPASPVIYLISARSLEAFRDKLPLEGTTNVGASLDGNWLVVDSNEWKNAVAYYTYAGEKLIRISIPGTGDISKKTTRCPFPEDATRVVAVGWDGSTRTVYEKGK